jgi:hypothetical protein
MPLKIDGPAGRQEITREYRDNYDRIFRGISSSKRNTTHRAWHATTPKKSKQDGGNNAKSSS